jgi:hypothetical protein
VLYDKDIVARLVKPWCSETSCTRTGSDAQRLRTHGGGCVRGPAVEAEDGVFGAEPAVVLIRVLLDHRRTDLDRATPAMEHGFQRPRHPTDAIGLTNALFDLDPAEQVLLAHGVQEGRMVG